LLRVRLWLPLLRVRLWLPLLLLALLLLVALLLQLLLIPLLQLLLITLLLLLLLLLLPALAAIRIGVVYRPAVSVKIWITQFGIRGYLAMFIYWVSANSVHSSGSRVSAIKFGKLSFILAGILLMVYLLRSWLKMLLMHGGHFFGFWLGSNTARAVEAGMVVIYSGVIYYCPVDVGIVNNGSIYINNSGIVTEVIAFPAAANKT
jgi:hypothetical protein